MSAQLSKNIAQNLKRLRDARHVSQQRLSDLSGVPRPTLANLESGAANPTLSLMLKVSEALQVTLDELLKQSAPPLLHYPARASQRRSRARSSVETLIAEPNLGVGFERVLLKHDGRWRVKGSEPGRRHHVYCEAGQVLLTAAGESCHVSAGDVVVVSSELGFTATNGNRRMAIVFRVITPALSGA